MFCYVRYYYAKSPDSMYFWMQKALPLFKEQKRYVKYFRMKAWYIYVLTRIKKNEEALKYAANMKEEVTELEFPEGLEMVNQALADFYLSNNLGEKGVALYEEVLKSMEMRNAPLVKRVHIIKQLMNKALSPAVKMKYTNRLNDYVNICKDKGISWLDEEIPVYYLEYVVHRHYALEYISLDNLPEALAHLKKAEDLLVKYEMYNYKDELRSIYRIYYKQSKQYNQALAVFDSLLPALRKRNAVYFLEMLKNKSDVLLESGRDRAAALAYREYAFLNDSLSKARFYNELAEMKTQHEVDKLELKNKEMDLEVAEAHSHPLQMGGGGAIFLFMLCCLLGYVSYSRHRYGLQLKNSKGKSRRG